MPCQAVDRRRWPSQRRECRGGSGHPADLLGISRDELLNALVNALVIEKMLIPVRNAVESRKKHEVLSMKSGIQPAK
jgi:hypothetical protein